VHRREVSGRAVSDAKNMYVARSGQVIIGLRG